jgi:hypothetical protein
MEWKNLMAYLSNNHLEPHFSISLALMPQTSKFIDFIKYIVESRKQLQK